MVYSCWVHMHETTMHMTQQLCTHAHIVSLKPHCSIPFSLNCLGYHDHDTLHCFVVGIENLCYRWVLMTLVSAHVTLLHWQPMPHQHIIDFLVKSI